MKSTLEHAKCVETVSEEEHAKSFPLCCYLVFPNAIRKSIKQVVKQNEYKNEFI